MSKKSNIAEESVRARKLLAKTAPQSLSPFKNEKVGLSSTATGKIGEYCLLSIVGPLGSNQYTVCHPIGITDLDDKSWVILRSEDVTATLSRVDDPRKKEIDQLRTKFRSEELVNAKLLVKEKGSAGEILLYYQCNSVNPRSFILASARQEMKATLKPLKEELSKLPKKGSSERRKEINDSIQSGGNILNYLDEDIRAAEVEIRKFLNDPALEEAACEKHPYNHRTLTGPFGDMAQCEVTGVGGKPLLDVVASLNKFMTYSMNLADNLPPYPGGVTGAQSSDVGKRRGKGKQRKKNK